ncbi:unnamed protein product [Brassica oleracea]
MIVEVLATIAKFEVLGGKPQLPSFLLKIVQEIPNWMTSSSATRLFLDPLIMLCRERLHQCQYLPQSRKSFHERVPPTNADQKRRPRTIRFNLDSRLHCLTPA